MAVEMGLGGTLSRDRRGGSSRSRRDSSRRVVGGRCSSGGLLRWCVRGVEWKGGGPNAPATAWRGARWSGCVLAAAAQLNACPCALAVADAAQDAAAVHARATGACSTRPSRKAQLRCLCRSALPPQDSAVLAAGRAACRLRGAHASGCKRSVAKADGRRDAHGTDSVLRPVRVTNWLSSGC